MRPTITDGALHLDPVVTTPGLQVAQLGFFSLEKKASLQPVNRKIPDFHPAPEKVAVTLSLVFRTFDFALQHQSAGELCKIRPRESC